jgi:tRNA pseudouridine38-40 synthase
LRRVRLVLEYDGTDFCGFQRQPGRRTVQGVIESLLGQLCGHPVEVTAAGRTDAGVHSRGQVLHFDTEGRIELNRLERVLNVRGGRELRVREPEETPPEFHARFGAVRRTYRYHVSAVKPPPWRARYVLWDERLGPDAAPAMEQALGWLVGENDFASFCAANSSARSTVRTLEAARVEGDPEHGLRVELTADAFLRSMVRIIMALLLEVGEGSRAPDSLRDVLLAADRGAAPKTAPAHGLVLHRVEYPDGYPAQLGAEQLDW